MLVRSSFSRLKRHNQAWIIYPFVNISRELIVFVFFKATQLSNIYIFTIIIRVIERKAVRPSQQQRAQAGNIYLASWDCTGPDVQFSSQWQKPLELSRLGNTEWRSPGQIADSNGWGRRWSDGGRWLGMAWQSGLINKLIFNFF